MRFSFGIRFPDSHQTCLDDPYSSGLRNGIASLFKEALQKQNPELYSECYGNQSQNTVKPFTFSYYAPHLKQIRIDQRNQFQFNGNTLQVHYSSSDYGFLVGQYNSLRHLKEYSLFQKPVRLGHFYLRNQKTIHHNEVLFKILSPFIVRKIENQQGVGYLKMDDPQFEDGLYFQIRNYSQRYLNKDLKRGDFAIDIRKCKPLIVIHYGHGIDCTTGMIGVKAPPDVLKLIYDIGLGSRRSQGFGMVEVVSC